MRDLKITLGRSADAFVWNNSTISWDDLCKKLKTTKRTAETVEQYHAMSRDDKEKAKDIGGFVGGHLKNSRRLAENMTCRSMLTLDSDSAKTDFLSRFKQDCRYAAVVYTTHGHTPEAPRYRIVIPFEEDISPDCYNAVARYFAAQWGIDQFDVCSYKVNQLMYWPSSPADGEYICEVIEGPWLNAMDFLAAYPDWRDISKLPIASKEKPLRDSGGKKQEDPLQKEGIVGTFCRTYSIHDVIAKFLSDVYAPSAKEGRYDYIPGDGTAGVVIYEDKFAYSHHATDPAGGRLMNAFDLVRLHRFGDEEGSFQQMCALAEEDEEVSKALRAERTAQAQKDFEEASASTLEPIPFGCYDLDPFPVDALPEDISGYIKAVAESTQTPVDMAGTSVLALLSVCLQGKYAIQGKDDWVEPLNLFANIIAEPSERKSAVLHATASPLDNYEVQYNAQNAARVEGCKMRRRILEKRQRAIEDKIAKGGADASELDQIAQEIANFVEEKPLRLYVDDITTEKLVSVMSSNNGRAALVSSEGGIFDTLAGIYTRNVNIDVMLKGYSGDTIRVDRIGRESESVMNPSLTVLLMTQPKVISDVLGNKTFRGRGLTARFLYCLPASSVGSRKFQSATVQPDVYARYERKMIDMLEDEYPKKPERITLSLDASRLLTGFAEEIEPKIKGEYAEIADWVGKLVGNTLRISGLLCRASVYRSPEFLTENEPLVVSGKTMADAIRLGRYFLSHAMAVFDVIPESNMNKQANRILQMIADRHLTEFDRRIAMRYCRVFKTVADIQPVLDFLDDYGYIIRLPDRTTSSGGRPPLPKYVVNPTYLSQLSGGVPAT